MIKLIKFLKPFIFAIIFAVILLFIQAMSELSLPDYMSKIVNVGIQQSGFENTVPIAITQKQLEKIFLFADDSSLSLIKENYILIEKNNQDFDSYLKDFPILEKENIYVLKKVSKNIEMELDDVFSEFLFILFSLENIENNEFEDVESFFKMISILPENQKDIFIESFYEKITKIDSSIKYQASITFLKSEYDIIGLKTEKIQTNYILKTGFFMLLIALVAAVCTISVGFLASKTAAGLARNLREQLFKKIESFSNTEFDKFSTSSLITRTTNDITQIQNVLVFIIRMSFYAPILGVGGILHALEKSSSMSWIIALAVIVLSGIMILVFTIAIPKFKLIQKLLDKLNLVTRENLSGMMVVRAFNTQEYEKKRFDIVNSDLTKTTFFINKVMAFLMPVIMFIMNGTTLLIIWVGSHQIAESNMQVGDMMAFMQYAMQIIFSFLMLSFMFVMVPRASVSAQRISEVLETEVTIKDPENTESFDKNNSGVVEFKNVSFKYGSAEENMLKNINFKAVPGKTTAIIGSTGSGKSTLVNLIPRFYDVTQGQILVNGIDVRSVTQEDLRNKIGYVPQKNILFSGTIESNMKYGNENISDEDLKKITEISQALDFINEKNEKFQHIISQGGANVSGGQKQRLSIARALAKNCDIYIFDDSFSALDFKTDVALRRQLKPYTKNSTVIIVAQRISTIFDADQILVLDEGKIVGKGSHKELLEKCSVYREIAFSQLSKEELA
jgi:ATP-binding cassette subfamily B protein